MQIHEVTLPSEVIGKAAKSAAQSIKNVVGSPIQSAAKFAGSTVGAAQTAKPAFQKIRQAYGQAKTAAKAAGIAGKAQTAWENYVQNLQATQQATPQVLQTALRAFVQKNLMGDLKYQYNTLTNVDQLESVIKQIVDPANAGKQKELWTQLVKTAGVSQAGGQEPGVTDAQPGGKKGKKGQPGGGVGANPADIAAAVQNAGISPAIYKNMGTILKSSGATANRTGNTVVDAFLQSLGFTLQ